MPTKDEEARRLANLHYSVEEGITHIFRITGTAEVEVCPNEPIKLLEVNANTIPSGVMPLQFSAAPARGIHYPSVIVEVTPEEYERILAHELKLPDGWSVAGGLPKEEGSAA